MFDRSINRHAHDEIGAYMPLLAEVPLTLQFLHRPVSIE